MKNCLSILAVAAAMLFCQTSFAQADELIYKGTEKPDAIGVISGSASIFNEECLCSLRYDFSQTHIVNFDHDNKTVIHDFGSIDEYNAYRGQDYVANWPVNLMRLEVTTCMDMSKKLKSEFRTKEFASDAKYDVVIRLALFDFGHFVVIGGKKNGGAILKGIMYVYEAGTENVVASFDLNYFRGNNIGYGDNDRIMQIGKAIAKELKQMAK